MSNCTSNNGTQSPASQQAYYLASGGFGISGILIAFLFYVWNFCCLCYQIKNHNATRRRQSKSERWDVNINPLTTLLAAIFGLIVIFSIWPQTIEGSAALLVVLAQASMLAWQDHDPDNLFKDVAAKIPDILGVFVATYALSDAQQRYEDITGNSFSAQHNTNILQWITYAFMGFGTLTGLIQEMLIYHRAAKEKKCLQWSSIAFTTIQCLATGFAGYFIGQTLGGGTPECNSLKIIAIVVLVVGSFYSMAMSIMRWTLRPVQSESTGKRNLPTAHCSCRTCHDTTDDGQSHTSSSSSAVKLSSVQPPAASHQQRSTWESRQ